LDELQAAFLSIKLKTLNQDNAKRIKIAEIYNENLKGVGDLILPRLAHSATSVYHLYIIRTKHRDDLQKYLADLGIGTMIHYPIPPHLQKAYAELGYIKGSFPFSEEIADTCLSLSIWPNLTISEIMIIVNAIKLFFNKPEL
jgi:dTDP-4-amino-4,6-dideoxygalactose transaminase